MRAPEFWNRDGLPALALSPLGALYALAGKARRWAAKPDRLPMPVICVGNVSAGGTGKTPTTLALAAMLTARGKKPWILTRGYGGREAGPVIVDPARHGPDQVGDEALLLTEAFPTVVAHDRPAGGRLAIEHGADVIIMDDGFQNPSLAKDFSILVFDGGGGLGNGRLLPAGPLRESLADAAARANLALIIGADETGLRARLPAGLPVQTAHLTPNPGDVAVLSGKRVVAFAGIGRPAKFFKTLRSIGADLRDAIGFADHHPFSPADLAGLRDAALREQATLVTTAKDFVRLAPADRADILVLRASLSFDDPVAVLAQLTAKLQ